MGLTSARETTSGANHHIFPRWTNRLREASALMVIGGLVYAIVLLTLLFGPQSSAIGYAPEQPVPYSHALHAGDLGLDCRYCHTTVTSESHAALPPAGTCMNCHRMVRTDSEKLALVRESAATGVPVPWVRVHDLPDFVFFNHSAHVTAGVGCESCHGRVDRMEVVRQVEELTMGWCLDCHRDPDLHLRPSEAVTVMNWNAPEDPLVLGQRLRQEHDVTPSTDCSTCHR